MKPRRVTKSMQDGVAVITRARGDCCPVRRRIQRLFDAFETQSFRVIVAIVVVDRARRGSRGGRSHSSDAAFLKRGLWI